jgi:hypothetical protein
VPRRDRRILLLAAAAMSAVLLVAALTGHMELVAYAAPICLLALPLAAGRYPGEDALERLRGRREPARSRSTVLPRSGPRRAASAFPRGGRLIARALAERAPPAQALT